jgi:hypothetical protein
LKEMKTAFRQLREETYGWKEGVEQAFKELANPDSFEEFRNFTITVFDDISDAISNFVDTGKFKIRDFISTVLREFLKMQIKLQVIAPMAGLFSDLWPADNTPTPNSNFGLTDFNRTYAKGGIITEKVVGIGTKTGSRYEIGEDGPEIIHSASDSFSAIAQHLASSFSSSVSAFSSTDKNELVSAIQDATSRDRQSLSSITERVKATDKSEVKKATTSITSFKEFFDKTNIVKKRAQGGVVDEHVWGIGESGTKWEFGENGPEIFHSTKDTISTLIKSIVETIRAPKESSTSLIEAMRTFSAQERQSVSNISERVKQSELTLKNKASSRDSEVQQINNFTSAVETSRMMERNLIDRKESSSEKKETSSETKNPPVEVHMHNAPQGSRVETSFTPQGGLRIDAWIEELMAQKMVRGKPAQVLQGVYGARPIVSGR